LGPWTSSSLPTAHDGSRAGADHVPNRFRSGWAHGSAGRAVLQLGDRAGGSANPGCWTATSSRIRGHRSANPNPSTPTRRTAASGAGPTAANSASSSTCASTRCARTTKRSPAALKRDAAAGAVEQPHPELTFQALHVASERLRGEIVPARRPTEVQLLGQSHDVPQRLEVH
jgi:hypothetical protein